MDDFQILIKAVIDAKDTQSQLNAIKNLSLKIEKLNLDQSAIDNLKRQLTSKGIDISLVFGNTSQLQAQATKVGQQIGEKISDSVKRANKVKLSFDTGDSITKIDQLRAKFEKLGFNSDEIKQKMQSVFSSYNSLESTISGGNNSSIISANDKFNQSLKETDNLYKQIKADSTQYYNITRQNKLSNDIQNWLTNNTAATRKAKNTLKEYLAQLNNGRVNVSTLDSIQRQFQAIDTKMRTTNKLGKSFFQTFTEGMKKFSYWTSSTFIVMKLIQEVKQGISFLSQLDNALTNINYTMDVTQSQLQNIGDSSIKMAKDLHTSANNILGAVKLYANAKETSTSILEKANPAIMLSNVTGFTGEQSAKYLQTIMNQFDLTQEDLMDISDKIQNISQNLAHDFSDGIVQINEGISTSGEVARAAGMDLAEYASMIGILVEKTGLQGGQLGNSLKTIITRTTKAGEILGIDEGEISAAEKSLRSIGIEVRKTDDEFNAFDDTMSKLSEKWETLSEVERSNISFNLAGTRQINVIQSLLKNWEEYEDLVKKADSATGTTLANQEKYAESLQGYLGKLKSTGESIWNNLLNSSELKTGISLLNTLTSAIEKFTSTFGLLGTIGLGAGLFAGFKNIGKCA